MGTSARETPEAQAKACLEVVLGDPRAPPLRDSRGSCSRRSFLKPLTQRHSGVEFYIKRKLNQNLSGNEVYCKACSLLVI